MLVEILTANEKAIAKRWTELVFGTYPQETTRLLAGQRDPFANPVGQMLRESVGPLMRALIEDQPDQECLSVLGNLMRVRSVQDLSASRAVGIIPLFRTAILEESGEELDRASLIDLVERVERLTMAAFDVFVKCREQLYEVRSHESARLQASLLKRAEQILAENGHDGTTAAGPEEESPVNQQREV